MVKFAGDAITGFSFWPLQVMVYFALVLGVLALLAIPVVAVLRLVAQATFFEGQATTIILLLLLSSFQLFFLFVLGQYVARTYDEARGRPLYVLAQKINFDDTQPLAIATVEVAKSVPVSPQDNR